MGIVAVAADAIDVAEVDQFSARRDSATAMAAVSALTFSFCPGR